MKTIWKYQLALTDGQQVLAMPKGARILHLGYQNQVPTLWAEVDSEADKEPRYFQIHGTGHPVANGGTYLGTVQASSSIFVWHVYDHGTEHTN